MISAAGKNIYRRNSPRQNDRGVFKTTKRFADGEEPVVVVPVVVDPVQVEVPAVVIVPQIRDVAVTVHVRLGAERTVSGAIRITTP